ncbi:hypothetical protein [Tropicibacter oceani]|uniref:Uncharacterized protein n=1 Tax=Tropicibacter oceani TaxID=3058420 RepID=A0ABY8QMT9_9RHOB|nr:hypothetical protein [Tropicibacter oceani]WGW05326.1 hypothetical protein QF118_07200 [Tropicibacter oceani]
MPEHQTNSTWMPNAFDLIRAYNADGGTPPDDKEPAAVLALTGTCAEDFAALQS